MKKPTGRHISQRGRRLPGSGVLCAVILLSSAVCSAAGPRSSITGSLSAEVETKVSATVSAETVRVAEPFALEIRVIAAKGSRVDFPSFGAMLGEFEVTDVVEQSDVPMADDTDQRVWIRRLTLESLMAGSPEIPAIEIHVRNKTIAQTLSTDAIPVQVTSLLEGRADPTEFRDIRSVVDIPLPQPASRAWLPWTLGGLAAAAAIAAVVFTFVRRHRPWMSPDAWAVRELQVLRNSADMNAADSEFVTEELTSILRNYLELQFGIPATIQTTDELLAALENDGLMDAPVRMQFAELLKEADMARFAGLQLSRSQLTRVVDDAEQVIQQIRDGLKTSTSTVTAAEAG